MYKLSIKSTGKALGTIDEDDLQVLIDTLEEEDRDDTDYFICAATIDLLDGNGASPALVKMLKAAVGNSEGVEVAWKKA